MNPEIISVPIALEMADGSTAIMQFIVQGRGDALPFGGEWLAPGMWRRAASDAAVFEEVVRAHGSASVLAFHRISPSDIPRDRTYRNAWTFAGGRIEHDMVKARGIHREKLREQRAPALAALDVDYMRADEAGNPAEKRRIATEKQRLRDATADPRIDAAQTVEALKAITGI